jgi:hypothetical protein
MRTPECGDIVSQHLDLNATLYIRHLPFAARPTKPSDIALIIQASDRLADWISWALALQFNGLRTWSRRMPGKKYIPQDPGVKSTRCVHRHNSFRQHIPKQYSRQRPRGDS